MSEDRRRFFRINSELDLACEVIPADKTAERITDFENHQPIFSIQNSYNYQIEQHMADFRRIEASMPEVARYLSVMEDQIRRLTELLAPDEATTALVRKQVSVSAQGIAYFDRQSLEQGQLIQLMMRLVPSGMQLQALARVISVETSEEADDDLFRISLDFEHIHEADRELLIKDIHAKQIEALNAARQSDD